MSGWSPVTKNDRTNFIKHVRTSTTSYTRKDIQDVTDVETSCNKPTTRVIDTACWDNLLQVC